MRAVVRRRRGAFAARSGGRTRLRRAAADLGREHRLRHAAIGGIFGAGPLAQGDGGGEGLAEMRSHVEFYVPIPDDALALFRTVLAEAELRAGNHEQAEAALMGLDQVGNRWWLAELLRACAAICNAATHLRRRGSRGPYFALGVDFIEVASAMNDSNSAISGFDHA